MNEYLEKKISKQNKINIYKIQAIYNITTNQQ